MTSHLIILPCHSIWYGGPSLGKNKDEWSLAQFQFEGNDHLCFIDHIKQSISLLDTYLDSILIISGGKTKAESTKSESQSYLNLASKLEVKALVLSRVYCEEFAKDSMENVIFLICRFFEITGTYPQKISIVGFEFKRSRFIENHLTALRFPIANIKYIGNAPEPPREREVEYFKDLNDSEYKFAVKYFEADWYGINPPLSTKKATRNPHSTEHTYQLSNPKFKDFFKEIEQVSLNEVIQSKLPSWK